MYVKFPLDPTKMDIGPSTSSLIVFLKSRPLTFLRIIEYDLESKPVLCTGAC